MGMTKEQLAAVHCEYRDFSMLASAGSGKTSTVAARIEHLVSSGADPDSILACTFTRKAGEELRERAKHAIWCGTLHSICYDMVSRNANLRVIPPQEAEVLIRHAAIQTGLCCYNAKTKKHVWKVPQKTLAEAISSRLDEQQDPKILAFIRHYVSSLEVSGQIDYDGLIIESRRYPEELRDVRHIIVDEAQDCDERQWDWVRWARSVAHKDCTLMCVGDMKQSIYGWRGARPDLFDSVSRNKLPLTQTFRCPRQIVDVANGVIVRNPEGSPTVSHRDGYDDCVTVSNCSVADAVTQMTDRLIPYRQIAILCRSNRMVDEVEKELLDAAIPSHVIKPAHRPGPLYWLLAYIADPYSPAVIEGVKTRLRIESRDLVGGIESVSAKLMTHEDPYYHEIGEAMEASFGGGNVSTVLSPIRNEYWMAEKKFWQQHYGGMSVNRALSQWSLPREDDNSEEAVTVCTIHQAKGLEWDAVIIPYLSDGVIPKPSAHRNIHEMEEERRLMYVAITRAREFLTMLHNGNQSVFIKEGVGVTTQSD